ncbi:MAG: hypothetical protein ACRDHP_06330 [Ktedonobacterales bacterium]
MERERAGTVWLGRRPIGCALAVLIVAGAAFGYLVFLGPGRSATYTDPAAGFSLRVPPSWTLATDPDGSHPTLINPASGATINVYATVAAGEPEEVLRAAAPAGATQMQQRTVAGAAAVDFVVPGTQGSGGGEAGTPAPPQVRMVLAAAKNSAGTTNLYTLMLTQRAGSNGDAGAFDDVVSSLSLAPGKSWLPFASSSGVPPPARAAAAGGCDAICWADANWSANDYGDDANGQACAAYDDNAGQYVRCATGLDAAPGFFQPDFQCAEYVSRALAQGEVIPGLASGGFDGAGGSGSGTGEWGEYSFNSYPFTYAGDAANGDTRYNLLGVGMAGSPGLYQYLEDSGLAANIHQDIAAARPGDVVFFYSGSITDTNREHVMLITSVVHDAASEEGIGGWDALLDGHNRAAYHRLLSVVAGPGNPFEILHLRGSQARMSAMATSGSGWATNTDAYGQPLAEVTTTGAGAPTATASLQLPHASACALAVYVPNGDATALATFTVTLADGTAAVRTVDESAVDGWVLLYRWGDAALRAPPVRIGITNATGTDGQSLGVGQVAALCDG